MVQTGVSPDFSSSGGFSNVFPIPDWQALPVAVYLSALGDTNAGLFNASGRAYPDVAAYGANAQIILGGAQAAVDGTSVSSPVFASVIALVNDKLLEAGKPVLGFLNPWLYANPAMLNDIGTGNNLGCGTNGFPAVSGWDPVTGLGSPVFTAMLSAAGL
jgi:tripeptidyl-peptidase-1